MTFKNSFIEKEKGMEKIKFLIIGGGFFLSGIIINCLKNFGFKNFIKINEYEEVFKTQLDDINFIIMSWDTEKSTNLIKLIRDNKKFGKLPILLMAFRYEKDEIDEYTNYDIIYKPFSPELLKEKIEKLVNKQKKDSGTIT